LLLNGTHAAAALHNHTWLRPLHLASFLRGGALRFVHFGADRALEPGDGIAMLEEGETERVAIDVAQLLGAGAAVEEDRDRLRADQQIVGDSGAVAVGALSMGVLRVTRNSLFPIYADCLSLTRGQRTPYSIFAIIHSHPLPKKEKFR
jgi:hypothetical protein